ncbi:MAG TPA: DUF748 domain-containing protein, partial [Anaeromyxobacteraceae bacterium]|nr:DUF748 domain-containing protein [Anaeromyxobacteraceae bacterium]
NTYNFSDLMKYLMLPVPKITLNDVAITGGSIDFHDRALPKEEHHTVRDAELIVPFLTTMPDRATEFGNPRFSATIDGAPLVVEAKVRGLPDAAEATADVDLKDLSLPVYLSYVPAEIPVDVRSGKLSVKGRAGYQVTKEWGPEVTWAGTVSVTGIAIREKGGAGRLDVGDFSVSTRITDGETRGLLVEDGRLEVKGAALPFARKDGLAVGLLAVEGVKFSESAGEISVDAVRLAGGSVRVSRDRKGVLSTQALVDGLTRRLPKRHAQAPEKPLRYRIGRLEGKGIDVTWTDGVPKETPTFSLQDAHFLVQDVTGPVMGKMPFELGARTGRDATLSARGWAVPAPLAADVEVQVRGIDLAVARPYLTGLTEVVLAGGRLEATLAAAVETRNGKLRGTWRGSAAIRDLDVLDRRQEKLVGWRSLTVDGIQGSLEPQRLQVAKIELTGLAARVVLEKDGTSNLPGGARPPTTAGNAGADAKPSAARPASKDAPRPEVQVDGFHLANGTVDIVDRSIPGDFKAQVRDIDVRLGGMSTRPGSVSDLSARMTLPKGAPLSVSGKAAPLKDPPFADVDLVIDGLDLTAANPYAATYLGLEIDRGALTVKSRAKLETGSLAAENRIRVDQLTYGKGVKSDKATILPVRLLTDILRDRNGDIVLVLPLKGRTDDDGLVGKLILQIVGEVVFPPSSPLRSIPFDACSDDLTGEARARLRKLSDALQERQAMKVVAVGYVDRDVDEKACVERLAVIRAAQAKEAAGPPAPPAPIGKPAAPAPSVPPPPTYLVLEGDARFQGIAVARAEAVRGFLAGEGKVDPSRVSARTGDMHAAPTKSGDARTRVEFTQAGD